MRAGAAAFFFVPLLMGCGTPKVQLVHAEPLPKTAECAVPIAKQLDITAVLEHAKLAIEKAEAAQHKAEAARREAEAETRRVNELLGEERYRACAPFCTRESTAVKKKKPKQTTHTHNDVFK